MSTAQVALIAAVQSVNAGDVSFGIEAVKRDIRARREKYLQWLNEQDENTTNDEIRRQP